ncbi:MAG TPA: VCBS repeat-containing protein [Candidatus Methylomirabilis sp.]|nr:VCBS repeat-containing protein [Candidatus Methylomirabilis sp.]
MVQVTAVDNGGEESACSAAANGAAKTDPDILWQNQATGAVRVWYMYGATKFGDVDIVQGAADLNWKVVGTADFNGDGHPDILWQNQATGAVRVWYMDGVTKFGDVDIVQGGADLNWKVVGSR